MSQPSDTTAPAAPFGRASVALVVGVIALSLVVAVALAVFGDELEEGGHSVGADTYSVSAIGHHGLWRMLGELGVPTMRSRDASAAKAAHGVLVLLEPSVSEPGAGQRLAAMVADSPRTLLVLPKWYGQAFEGETWIHDASLRPISDVAAVLDALGLEAEIARAERVVAWQGDLPEPALTAPQTLRSELYQPEATVSDDEALLFRVDLGGDDDARSLWVLSDPDVLNNHGLARPQNARFTFELLERLRDGGPVVFDETAHGYGQAPSLTRALFRFPLVLATLQVLICGLLAAWAALVRFGPPLRPAPALAPGKDFLIRNTAALLAYGGHHAETLQRYLSFTIELVRHALHAPSLPPEQMTRWLDEVQRRRGGSIELAALQREVAAARQPEQILKLARRVGAWRMEMTNGAIPRT